MVEEKKKYDKPLKYETLIYVGKEAGKKFVNDDKSETISYAYKFKRKEEDMYPIKFWGYSNTKGQEILKELDNFTIGYIEKDNPRGEFPIKNARFFGEPKEQPTETTPTAAPQQTTDKLDANIKEFLKNVTTSHGIGNASMEQLVTDWFVNYHVEEANKIIPSLKAFAKEDEVPTDGETITIQ